eukprot:TRINITY_DN2430_c0_g1_i3.p1 TRINITY_DN2430_c0_g1~~TRINITY_DN2430_c0_g1_i3.p1  ORF type:complete len:581 (-),score=138.35 TRINITY_DN2430_c0_g1_i3:19-1722(-)
MNSEEEVDDKKNETLPASSSSLEDLILEVIHSVDSSFDHSRHPSSLTAWDSRKLRRALMSADHNHHIVDALFNSELGIPPPMRALIWKSLLFSSPLSSADQDDVITLRDLLDINIDPVVVTDIAKDVSRTHIAKITVDKNLLTRLLTGYAAYKPHLGYCQGMNSLAAAVVLAFDPSGNVEIDSKEEEEVFRAFKTIVDQRVHYYSKNMTGVLLDGAVLNDLLEFEDYELSHHLNKLNCPPSMLCSSWMLCLFVKSPFHLEHALALWDLLLILGDEVIFLTILAVFHRYREHILNVESQEAVIRTLMHLVPNQYNFRSLLESVSKIRHRWKDLQEVISGLRQANKLGILESKMTLSRQQFKKARIICDLKDMELLKTWRIFIQPNPWEIISYEMINSVFDFHQALVNSCFKEESSKWKSKGLAGGVFSRLFAIRSHSKGVFRGGVSFEDFLKLTYVLSGDPGKNYRLVLCFQFCDWNNDGLIDKSELRIALEHMDSLYKDGALKKDQDLFCDVVFMKHGLNNSKELEGSTNSAIGLKEFQHIAILHPLLMSFFRLDDVLSGGIQHLEF